MEGFDSSLEPCVLQYMIHKVTLLMPYVSAISNSLLISFFCHAHSIAPVTLDVMSSFGVALCGCVYQRMMFSGFGTDFFFFFTPPAHFQDV